ncbi:hypothetical protein L1887_07316 [Cichorium endivia]|nr:hypothetical protein L1887_07316 [Cichorium endivia]
MDMLVEFAQPMSSEIVFFKDERQEIATVEITKLDAEAAAQAIEECGKPKSNITHVVFCTTTGIDMPGADYQLIKLLGLLPSVKRVMMYNQGCFAEISAVTFRGPDETYVDSLIGQDLFGDDPAAIIVGSDPFIDVEKPLFKIVYASQTILPDSEDAIKGHLLEAGLTLHLLKDVPGLITKHIEKSLVEAFQPFSIVDWNSLFWIPHLGGRAILDKVEKSLSLTPDKLRVTCHVLSEYGNLSCASVLVILNETSATDGSLITREGLDWGCYLDSDPVSLLIPWFSIVFLFN